MDEVVPPQIQTLELTIQLSRLDVFSRESFKDDEWPFAGKGKPDDVCVPSGAGCIEINKLLAVTLPVAPGLFVDDVGSIFTPLRREEAEALIALCEKSPFGHNMDTKMDEAVRKSWQLHPDAVHFNNSQWQVGLDKLNETIADRLGYEGVPLQCKLYKLLVYGEGGHFLKHQDTEKEDGMIATLVVQPPSAHEGGNLLVYRSGEVKYCHDFGKASGTAPYYLHYAVHYADAEHSVEKVTKGYRLVLVYSICLPQTMCYLERKLDHPLSEDLAKAFAKLEGETNSFALLLAHEYTAKSIRDLGWRALKGVDSARFHALDGANDLVKTVKKLKIFIAQLVHDVSYREDRRVG
ncbi:hypothetical protein PHYPSEUDO_009222 [Phytophthora pseudosyringae]|uniref:Fe2OG dioxygenase domain-containing protein n=1 Tax=Phytophthora pseudosyringae TaxID=221518 RepID=A0A8T1WCJ1_9STRA|nr:hypothetical protein PHYPSEUDO_009222 [Phytophthora pseudosyringae]